MDVPFRCKFQLSSGPLCTVPVLKWAKQNYPAFASSISLRRFFFYCIRQSLIIPSGLFSWCSAILSLHVYKFCLSLYAHLRSHFLGEDSFNTTSFTVFVKLLPLPSYDSTFKSAQYAWRLILNKNFVSWRILVASLVAITKGLLIPDGVLSTVGDKKMNIYMVPLFKKLTVEWQTISLGVRDVEKSVAYCMTYWFPWISLSTICNILSLIG